MTDLVTRHDAEDASADGMPTIVDDAESATDDSAETAAYEWAPDEPEHKKRRWWLWLGIPAALIVVALVITSLLLIAPGTAVAGVPVGGMTQGAAAEAIETRLAQTTVELTGPGGDATLTGAELGASVDAEALAEEAFTAHPAWKVTDWYTEPVAATVTLDAEKATAALRTAAADLYIEPTDATIAFDGASGNYIVTPAVDGQGVDVDAIQARLQGAFDAGETSASMDPVLVPVPASGTTAAAQQTADGLNAMLGTVGFYIGEERTVPVDRIVAASWLTVSTGEDGAISVTADPALIQPVVDTLPAAINRAPVNATVITDTGGRVLSTTTAGVEGREVGDTAGAADALAAQLADMNGVYAVPVNVVAPTTVSLARNVVVDLSEQRTYLYENGAVVSSYLVSTGKPATPTNTGNFRINSHIRVQDMGALCYNPAAQDSYCTKDVPWVMFFNGDQGFHGTYWHSNFGRTMSHGCVNMTIDAARFLYDWAPNGVEVKVQN